MDVQANGGKATIQVGTGQEQYCRTGEVVQFANGTLITDIKCESKLMEVLRT